MLMSSTKARIFFPIGGPNVSLVRFSTDDSMMRWTSKEEVLEEKFRLSVMLTSGERLRR